VYTLHSTKRTGKTTSTINHIEMTTEEDQQKVLDSVLDAALDDLDSDDDDGDKDEQRPVGGGDQNDSTGAGSSELTSDGASRPVQGPMPPPPPPPSPPMMSPPDMAGIDEMMRQLMQGGLAPPTGDDDGQADEFLGRLLQEMQSQIGTELQKMDGQTSAASSPSPKKNAPQQKSPPPKKSPQQSTPAASTPGGDRISSEVDRAVASLVDGMTNQAKLDEANMRQDPSSSGMMEDDFLKNMMQQLGEVFGGGDDGGGGINADALLDGMMEQLLSKDLMYEPIQKVTEKFPAWLEQNKGKLPPAEYEQYVLFCSIVHF